MAETKLFNVMVTADELQALRHYREVREGENVNEVSALVLEALRKPPVTFLLERWGNGVITLRIEFENRRVKYVTPFVEGPRLKAGREI